MKDMTCRQCERRMSAFIEDTLSVKETREMLKHIRGCSECMDELEVQLMVGTARGVYDSDFPETYDLRNLASDLIGRRRRRVLRAYLLNGYGLTLAALVVLILVLLAVRF